MTCRAVTAACAVNLWTTRKPDSADRAEARSTGHAAVDGVPVSTSATTVGLRTKKMNSSNDGSEGLT